MKNERHNRYAAMMLYQYRTVKNGISNKRRVCEERIILFEAECAEKALELAKKRGKDEEFFYTDKGAEIFFEFVGITELIELGISLEPDEVWYRLTEKVRPMERHDKLIPDEKNLTALNQKSIRKKGRVLIP